MQIPYEFPIARLKPAVLAVLLALCAPLWARDVVVDPYREYRDEVERGEFSYQDSEDVPWIENETEVLAMPKSEDLVEVRIDQLPDGMQLLIDRSRITVGPKDRVIRVWLWMRSEHGAEHGTFEGFRCETREYKVYAYANPGREPPVSKAKKPRWLVANESRIGNYRLELLQDYFCGIRGTRTAHEIRAALTGDFRRETFFSN